jgi:hypothetical protein
MAVWCTANGVDGRPDESRFWGRRDESCACPGAASRVVVWEPLIWSLFVRQLESWADGGLEVAQQRVWRCLVVLGSHNTGVGAAVLGMVV